MKWTKERPKESGWYWVDDGKVQIAWVDFDGKDISVLFLNDFVYDISEFKQEYVEWAGPIPEPED